MSVTQTVEIPASRRLVIDVPREVPTGPVVLIFKPVAELVDPGPPPDGVDEFAEELSLAALDAFEEDLKRATPEMLAVLNKATVTFSMADDVDRRTPKERGDV